MWFNFTRVSANRPTIGRPTAIIEIATSTVLATSFYNSIAISIVVVSTVNR